MSRIEDILVKVRDTLNDADADRWSDKVLLRLLYDGCCDIAAQANVLRDIAYVQIRKGRYVYTLPSDLLVVKAVVYKGKELPIKSTDWLAQQATHWRKDTTTQEITHIVYDKLDNLELQVYPRPLNAKEEYATLTPDQYGTDIAISDYSTEDGVFGLVSDIIDSEHLDEVTSPFGIITDINSSDFLVVYYVHRPATIDDVDDELELAPLCDTALKHYVCGMALRNDLDVQNRQMASEELDLYQRELRRITSISSTDKVVAKSHGVLYNGMG